MKVAIISDIHGNLEALEAVLEDIENNGVETIYCLGDIIGYGPNPRECLQIVQEKTEWSLIGNHEEAVLYGALDFSTKARKSIDWTRSVLKDSKYGSEENETLWQYLKQLPRKNVVNDFVYVHATPRQPTREYLLPKDAQYGQYLEEVLESLNKYSVAFGGHTHWPGVFSVEKRYQHPRELRKGDTYSFSFDDVPGKKIVNVGSVGQPRDHDQRSCYLILEENQIVWRRVSYDYQTTARKIKETSGLDNFLADRLKKGI